MKKNKTLIDAPHHHHQKISHYFFCKLQQL